MERFDTKDSDARSKNSQEDRSNDEESIAPPRESAIRRQMAQFNNQQEQTPTDLKAARNTSTSKFHYRGHLIVMAVILLLGIFFVFIKNNQPAVITPQQERLSPTTHIVRQNPGQTAAHLEQNLEVKFSDQSDTPNERPLNIEKSDTTHQELIKTPSPQSTEETDKRQQAEELLAQAAELVPALKQDPRYQLLIDQVEKAENGADSVPPLTTNSTSDPQEKTPAVTGQESAPIDDSLNQEKSAVSAPINQSAAPLAIEDTANTNDQNNDITLNSPNIYNISITPGVMREERFQPDRSGRVFMVKFSYQNFYSRADFSLTTLIAAQIRFAGDPLLLAERKITIDGQRGTKYFAIDTLMKNNTMGVYQLDFLLNGQAIATHQIAFNTKNQ